MVDMCLRTDSRHWVAAAPEPDASCWVRYVHSGCLGWRSPPRQKASWMQLVSLVACLRPRKVNPVVGAPPEYLCDAGVACLCLDDLVRLGGCLGQPVVVKRAGTKNLADDLAAGIESLSIEASSSSSTVLEDEDGAPISDRKIVLTLWPLNTVPPGCIATTEVFFGALGVPYVESLPRRVDTTPSKAAASKKSVGSGKKKQKSLGRRSSSGVAESSPRPESKPGPPLTAVDLALVGEDLVTPATRVVLSSPVTLTGTHLLDLRDRLQNLAVMVGSTIATCVRGEQALVTVSEVIPTPAGDRTCSGFGRVVSTTKFTTQDNQLESPVSSQSEIESESNVPVCGLDREADEIRNLLRAASFHEEQADTDAEAGLARRSFLRPRGVLLHGPPGTGKTSLAMQIAKEAGAAVHFVSGPQILGAVVGDSERRLANVFAEANNSAPCVIILDEVDAICGRRQDPNASDADVRLTSVLLLLMDKVPEGVFVIGTTNRPNSVDEAMRRAGRFDVEISIPVPSSGGRIEILKGLMSQAQKNRVDLSDSELAEIAYSAHGFVGADLAALWREAARNALQRSRNDARISREDLVAALRGIKPSALRDFAVEVPRVKWEDVGGNEGAKMRLKEAVEWRMRGEESPYANMGIRPPKGVLLFGPPGCSKTLLAKAVATEAGANFLSVKGPELLSKYVGDSEKAVRSIFMRARSVAPSVIFFDELDALAGSRGRGGAEDRVLAQLLTEMDGFSLDANESVVVIAATNRPDLIDAALLRPGRMDSLVYVGLPDVTAREDILRIHMRKQPWRNVDIIDLARRTEGYSGAELAAIVREAALAAMEEDVANAREVHPRHYDTALTRVQPRTSEESIAFYRQYRNTARGVIIQ